MFQTKFEIFSPYRSKINRYKNKERNKENEISREREKSHMKWMVYSSLFNRKIICQTQYQQNKILLKWRNN